MRVLGSFRARVTLALFGFFVLSIAIFGTLAFQTLSGAAERTATALAERLVEDGASGYLDVAGQMEILAQEVGADLLEYRNGELIEGSAEELVELGLYEGWVPEPIFRSLEDRTEVRGTYRASLARWAYVMAYRRLPDGDILATPVPVEAGATALRRQEVADLLGFAIVLGAALSLALAFLVGGTLTRPIETLQIASERVGSGEPEGSAPRRPEGRVRRGVRGLQPDGPSNPAVPPGPPPDHPPDPGHRGGGRDRGGGPGFLREGDAGQPPGRGPPAGRDSDAARRYRAGRVARRSWSDGWTSTSGMGSGKPTRSSRWGTAGSACEPGG